MQSPNILAQGIGGPSTPAFSLGMATTFALQTNPQRGPGGNMVGTGSIQFQTGNDFAMWLNQARSLGVPTTVTITNVSTTGTVVYVMKDAMVTQTQLGPAITAAFRYNRINWTMYSPRGTVLQQGGCTYNSSHC